MKYSYIIFCAYLIAKFYGTENPSVANVERVLTKLSIPVDSEKIGRVIPAIEGREFKIMIGRLIKPIAVRSGGNETEEEAAPLDLGDMFDF